MPRRVRRGFLQACGAVFVAGLAGCVFFTNDSKTTSLQSKGTPPDNETSLSEWTESTDCEDEPEGMHDSVIRVQQVMETLASGSDPIQFSELSTAEQSILRTVTEKGGYATCNTSEAFDRFVSRVQQHRGSDATQTVYLEREGTYYRLFVRVLDEVYAY